MNAQIIPPEKMDLSAECRECATNLFIAQSVFQQGVTVEFCAKHALELIGIRDHCVAKCPDLTSLPSYFGLQNFIEWCDLSIFARQRGLDNLFPPDL